MIKDLYKEVRRLFYSLNKDLLEDLEEYTIKTSADMVISGDCYHEYTLEKLIKKHCDKYPCDSFILEHLLKDIQADNDSNDYYDLIDYMLYDIDI